MASQSEGGRVEGRAVGRSTVGVAEPQPSSDRAARENGAARELAASRPASPSERKRGARVTVSPRELVPYRRLYVLSVRWRGEKEIDTALVI